MNKLWRHHVFSAELPYEKDQIVSLFLRERFERLDSFIMSLGQMSILPPSTLHTYRNGKLQKNQTYTANYLNAAGFALYFYYIPKALIFVVFDLLQALSTIHFTCDIFFAQHFLPAFIAVILKKLGVLRCKKIVFWMFDFFVIPPEITRSLYYRGMDLMQGYLRNHVDELWYTTPRLLECDRERFGALPASVTVRLTHGCFFRRIPAPKPAASPPLKLAFLGSLRTNNAIYETIDTVEHCVTQKMTVELHIIGSGPEEVRVKEYVKKKKLSSAVFFYGFEDRGDKIAEILSACHLGMALHPADPYGPNWYLTSGKFRRYISQRLPVITTSVPYFAKYIYDYRAGLVVDNNPVEVSRAIRSVYSNPALLESMRSGVDTLYALFQADTVLDKSFQDLIKTIR